MQGESPIRTLFSVENEYGVAAPGVTPAAVCRELFRKVRREYAWVRDACSGRGVFLSSGARLYVDHGVHPEFAAPEVRTPLGLAAYQRAGDRIVRRAVSRVPGSVVLRTNIDYEGLKTWGSHENYLTRMPPKDYAEGLIPHLCSRVLYTGAGGFEGRNAGFTLSPRVQFLSQVRSQDSTGSDRAIFNTRNERLCDGYYRLHVLCGERTLGDPSTVLRFGTTALVLAAMELGATPSQDWAPSSPLDAMRAFAADPSCRARVDGAGRRTITALDIQRHYLDIVAEEQARGRLPEFAGPVLSMWSDVLAALSERTADVTRTVDWAIKHDHLLARGQGGRSAPELRAADVRFAMIGGGFDELEAAGKIAAPMVPEPLVEGAVRQAPLGTRARARGALIETAAAKGPPRVFLCTWDAFAEQEGRFWALPDPFDDAAPVPTEGRDAGRNVRPGSLRSL